MSTNSQVSVPRATRVGRLAVYLQRTFPPAFIGPYFLVHALAFYVGLDALAGSAPVYVGWEIAIGAVSVYLFALLLRVYDDVKDTAADSRLAAGGDARYQDRPAVTGEVRPEDLAWFRTALTVALLMLNLPFAGTWAFPVFLATYLLCWLSSRWFFWPRVSRSLALACVTHNPLILVLLVYLLAIYGVTRGLSGVDHLAVVCLLLGLWLPWTAWETSRKIRIPEDETTYQTYSQVFGRAAPLVPAGLMLVSCMNLILCARWMSLSWVYPAVLAGAAGIAILACLRFLLRPSRRHAVLRPYVDLYGLAANLGLLAAIVAGRGVAVS